MKIPLTEHQVLFLNREIENYSWELQSPIYPTRLPIMLSTDAEIEEDVSSPLTLYLYTGSGRKDLKVF